MSRITRGAGPAKRSAAPTHLVPPAVLIALDPASATGAALFVKGKLHATALLASKAPAKASSLGPAITRAASIGDQLLAWYATNEQTLPDTLLIQIAYEWPQIYQRGAASKTKGDPNNMLMLAAIATGAVLRLRQAMPAHVKILAYPYTPATWIGQLKKDPKVPADQSPRGQLVARNLNDAESLIARAQLQHDVWDAIGIGLFHLGRLKAHVNHFFTL